MYGLHVVRLKEKISALLETTVQEKATNDQTIDMEILLQKSEINKRK